MSGSLREVRGELAAVRLRLLEVPLRLPSRRRHLPARLFASHDEIAAALPGRVRALAAQGRAVLVGSASVAQSRRISAWLDAAAIAHQVLNAEQSDDEARIVAAAGQPGSVTVATNMAGRGTDIRLDASVAGRADCMCSVASSTPRDASIASSPGAARARAIAAVPNTGCARKTFYASTKRSAHRWRDDPQIFDTPAEPARRSHGQGYAGAIPASP